MWEVKRRSLIFRYAVLISVLGTILNNSCVLSYFNLWLKYSDKKVISVKNHVKHRLFTNKFRLIKVVQVNKKTMGQDDEENSKTETIYYVDTHYDKHKKDYSCDDFNM